MTNKTAFDHLGQAVSSALPPGLSEDIKRNIHTVLISTCDRLGLVTREELEVQEQVLQRMHQQLQTMEHQLIELEQTLLKKT
ncbi:MAG: hypothetical protein BMS9Abin11_0019 [Gammaproteobacteria bacterium]|nr:MAG: hypothetical protein BMS9Abin11_0019 [Gammaproteobacteria bacterium]